MGLKTAPGQKLSNFGDEQHFQRPPRNGPQPGMRLSLPAPAAGFSGGGLGGRG